MSGRVPGFDYCAYPVYTHFMSAMHVYIHRAPTNCFFYLQFLDLANGAPLGISDYKYGLRVSVVALRSPPVWTTEKGLEMGGPRAFGLDIDYEAVGVDMGTYAAPKSVWDLYA